MPACWSWCFTKCASILLDASYAVFMERYHTLEIRGRLFIGDDLNRVVGGQHEI